MPKDTREHILHVATEVFGEKGFKSATVRDICSRAGVGVASVNYHFGDKEALMNAVIEDAIDQAFETYPILLDRNEDDPAEERLMGFVEGALRRINMVKRGAIFAKLLLDPVPVGKKLHRKYFASVVAANLSIARDLLGPAATEEEILFCARSIGGQCMIYSPFGEKVFENRISFMSDEEIKMTARHITDFSLAGIKAMIEKRNS